MGTLPVVQTKKRTSTVHKDAARWTRESSAERGDEGTVRSNKFNGAAADSAAENALASVATLKDNTLQWGRDQSVAEKTLR